MNASENGHLEIVKYLVERGADLNAKANSKSTALIYAYKEDHLEIVKYLVEHGANVYPIFTLTTANFFI